MDDLKCDIAYILQNRDFTVLQKLTSHCCNFRGKVATKVEETTAYKIEYEEKRHVDVNKLSHLQEEMKNVKAEIDGIKLQQKIIDKKILNAVSQEQTLKEEIDSAKSQRDCLSLEMVDLQQESEKRKEKRLLTWNAIKRACYTYKKNLDFHINFEGGDRHIKISFFVHDTDTKDKYCVHLVNSEGQWKVEQIQPILKKEHINHFDSIVNFSKQSEVLDITAFLCQLRHVFIKYYIGKKE